MVSSSFRMIGEARNRFEDEQLPALDAFGDGHFALARQERHGAHFAQVHANRVVGLLRAFPA